MKIKKHLLNVGHVSRRSRSLLVAKGWYINVVRARAMRTRPISGNED